MLTDFILMIVCGILCALSFILGALAVLSADSEEQHRAYLKGYEQGKKERRIKNGNSNSLRQMQKGNKGKEQKGHHKGE